MSDRMSDGELTRLCAEAMGLILPPEGSAAKGLGMWEFPNKDLTIYRPLHDDAQCFALVKKFNFVIERERNDMDFGVTLFTPGNRAHPQVVRGAKDLNHAICECVAKMQEEKRCGTEK